MKRSRNLWCARARWTLLAAAQGTPADYVRQWPLALEQADAGAYRVELTEEIYRQATGLALDDVQVFNAAGQPVATALQVPPRRLSAARVLRSLPWFPLPEQSIGGDLRLLTVRDADGRVQGIQTAVTPSNAGTPGGWLLDASGIDASAHALQLEWEPPAAPLQLEVRVEASDDLRQWSTLQRRVPLVDLSNDGRRLQQRRIMLQTRARYLRVSPLAGRPLPTLRQASLEVDEPPPPPRWEWLQAAGQAVGGGYEFALDGRFPVEVVDLALADNSAVEWTLFSRDSRDTGWVRRAGPWLAFHVGEDGQSPPQPLAAPVRDRYWRLVPAQPGPAPQLRWGYRGEAVVFLAQGEGPFALAAGSGRARRSELPIDTLLSSLRQQRGGSWQPAPARIAGPAVVAGGEAALAAPRDWKNLTLWTVLVLGAMVVAGFAVSLLRHPPRGGDAD